MTTLTELRLQRGSFRGIQFLWDTSSTTAGRKTIVHEFPNSDRRVVEDLGFLNNNFQIDIVLHNRRSLLDIINSQDYYTWRDSFKRALDQEGPGILIHPLYGSRMVSALNYTITESQRDLGICRISVIFSEGVNNIYPQQSGNNAGIINNLAVNGISGIGTNIQDYITNANISSVVYNDLIGKGYQASAAFNGISKKYYSNTGTANSFTNAINSFENSVPATVIDSAQYGSTISNLLTLSNDYGNSGFLQFSIAQELFDFGNTDIPFRVQTNNTNIIQNNRNLINEAMQTGGLINAYRNVPFLDLSDEVRVAEVQQILRAQFKQFESFSTINEELIDIVKTLRVQVSEYLADAAEAAFRISTIQVNNFIPMSVLVYQYYGNLDNVARIQELNITQDPSFTIGPVQVLTP
jgi:hypothetical protein